MNLLVKIHMKLVKKRVFTSYQNDYIDFSALKMVKRRWSLFQLFCSKGGAEL